MKHLGKSLEHSLLQLPQLTTKVALIYNLKLEAPPASSPALGYDSSISADEPSLTPSTSSDASSTVPVVHRSHRAGDLYAEWDTMETINAVRTAVEARYEVVMIEADESAYQKMLENRPFFAFNMAEGLNGVSRESQVPAMLEMLGIPYLGSDPLTLAVCLDKSRAKEILSYYNLPTAPFLVVRTPGELEALRVSAQGGASAGIPLHRIQRNGDLLRLPAMVKPLHEGSSKGIYDSSLVRTVDQLLEEVSTVLSVYEEPALVEEFLPGREFTVGVLGNGDQARTLPIVELRFDSLPSGVNQIYSYEAKWIWDRVEDPLNIFQCPARLDSYLEENIRQLCLDAYRVLGCRDWARIDARLDAAGVPHILELNPLPGVLPKPEDNSCLPKAARAAGMSYNELINHVLDIAMTRCGIPIHQRRQQVAAVH